MAWRTVVNAGPTPSPCTTRVVCRLWSPSPFKSSAICALGHRSLVAVSTVLDFDAGSVVSSGALPLSVLVEEDGVCQYL